MTRSLTTGAGPERITSGHNCDEPRPRRVGHASDQATEVGWVDAGHLPQPDDS